MKLKEFWVSLSSIHKSKLADKIGIKKQYLSQIMHGHVICGEIVALKIVKEMGKKAEKGAYEELRGRGKK